MIKKFILMLAVITIFTVSFIGFSSSASAEPFRFTTGDGQWDGGIQVPNGADVSIGIVDWGSDMLKVRLCSAATGNCTAYKPIFSTEYGNVTFFTNMAGGYYYGDVAKATYLDRQVTGIISLNLD